MSGKLNKKVFTWHQWLGLYAGIVVLVLSVTGAILVFGQELDSSLHSDIMKVEPGSSRVPLDPIAGDLKKRYPAYQLNKIELQQEYPAHALYAELDKDKRKTQVFYNQYTGAFLGERVKDAGFVHTVKKLHTELLLSRPGKIIVAIMGICLFLTTLTGIYFYRKSLLSVFRIGVRWDKNLKTISSDAHKLVGVSTLLFNVMIAITGFYMHGGELLPQKEDGKEKAKQQKGGKFLTEQLNFSVDSILTAHQHAVTGFIPGVVDFPKPGKPQIKLKGNTPSSSRLTGGKFDTEIQISARDYKLDKIITSANRTAAQKADKLMSEIHYGMYGGIGIQFLYAFCGIGTGLLSITGFILWYKKKYKKKPAKAIAPRPIVKPAMA